MLVIDEVHPDFPPPNEAGNNGAAGTSDDKKPFINRLFSYDSLTTCEGFINSFKKHNDMYFASVGIFQGSVPVEGEEGKYQGDITNFDILVGRSLTKWVATMEGEENPLKGVRFRMEIRNLKFIPHIHEGKPYNNTRGILETVKIGKLIA